jgi:16S rRNA (cytidine1402-2'-O)-methyltransferase
MLYLLPNLLADLEEHTSQLPRSVDAAVAQLTSLIAESEKQGRRFLRRFSYPSPKTFRDIPIHLLNEHTTPEERKALVQEMAKGGIWGLVSDCGMPCLADPGADLVFLAREKGIPIQTFSGPSSILFALLLSGLGGQQFTFHGYLPKEEAALGLALKGLKKGVTHLFIETPYRNARLFEKILSSLPSDAWLCLACDLTASTQFVSTKRIDAWKRNSPPNIDKHPCVFVVRQA